MTTSFDPAHPASTDDFVSTVLPLIIARFQALLQGNATDSVALDTTNLPVGAKRWNWNAGSPKLENWNGSTWSDYSNNYAINANLFSGQNSAYYTDIISRLGYTPANVAGQTFTGNLATNAGLFALSTNGNLYLHSASAPGSFVNVDTFSGGHSMVRFYENAGSNKGASLDLSLCGVGASSALWHSDNFNPANYASLTGSVAFTGGVSSTNYFYAPVMIMQDAALSGGQWWINGGSGHLNIHESSGSVRGVYIDIGECVAGSAAKLWHSGNVPNPLDKSGGVMTGSLEMAPTTGTIAANTGGVYGATVQNVTGSGNAAYMAFLRNGAYGMFLGLDTDNYLKVGGWSMGANSYRVNHQGDTKFAQGFQSADYPVVLGGSYTVAHGLGKVPVFSNVYWVCQTAEYGFNVGDVVSAGDALHGTSYASWGGSGISFDASNLYINIGGTYSCEGAARDGSFYLVDLTPANWKIRVVAWA